MLMFYWRYSTGRMPRDVSTSTILTIDADDSRAAQKAMLSPLSASARRRDSILRLSRRIGEKHAHEPSRYRVAMPIC